MRNLLREKKGDVSDVFVFMIIVVFLAISFIVVLFANSKLQEVIETTPLGETTASTNIINAFENINNNTVQRGFVLFISFLIIGILASSFLVRVHPAFLFLYILVLGVTIFTAVYGANVYDAVRDNAQLASIAADQDMINYIMEHLVTIVLAVGALSMIVVFSKIFSTPGGGMAQDGI